MSLCINKHNLIAFLKLEVLHLVIMYNMPTVSKYINYLYTTNLYVNFSQYILYPVILYESVVSCSII